jgi:hypothetical protein
MTKLPFSLLGRENAQQNFLVRDKAPEEEAIGGSFSTRPVPAKYVCKSFFRLATRTQICNFGVAQTLYTVGYIYIYIYIFKTIRTPSPPREPQVGKPARSEPGSLELVVIVLRIQAPLEMKRHIRNGSRVLKTQIEGKKDRCVNAT